ncbi:hypothetical protein [Psychroserpens ponticola]|uniref:DUF5655 domain-containing protein n=1 Tax=Psychroserpens ponticola TaxID=2932268 RepID=A0ABY7S274_9FLAO|nr:hypothetical protein [Psychroserpens ponticola]WCO03490.1 hypothetical protein MUN68_008270 [Psychroserpens ponticola]
MSKLEFTFAEKLSLKNSPDFNEDWLQNKIAENPQILGLGELDLIERERKHKSGRLDLLLADTQNEKRYEVEIMLGELDASHIIRCLEYWDIEKKRYPHYEHCAVIVAEDITSRFLNVLSLFNGHIPLIAIQLNALKVGNKIVLDFVTVMNQFALRRDDTVEAKLVETNRDYWNKRATKKTVEIVDKLLEILNSNLDSSQQLNYNKYYIGLNDGFKSRNFIHFKPKKQFTHIYFELMNKEEWIEKLDDLGITSTANKRNLQVTVTPKQVTDNINILTELIKESVEFYNN